MFYARHIETKEIRFISEKKETVLSVIAVNSDDMNDWELCETTQGIITGYDGKLYLESDCPVIPQKEVWQRKANEIRERRNALLLKSDWTDLPNAPLGKEDRAKWQEYRRKLRDIPTQKEFPEKAEWPVL